ncbi:hypothetical protein D3C87_1661560 [compost metagenome]
MRLVSMVSGWLVVLFWMLAQIYLNITQPGLGNNGLIGTALELEVGWWSVFLLAALGILSAWASWGMWPFAFRKK